MSDNAKPKKAPPARFAQKALSIEEEESKIPKEVVPVKKIVDLDDMPIGGRKIVNVDDVPIGGAKQHAEVADELEDKPLPRGAYNLDALGADAFGSDTLMTDDTAKPKRAPPARLGQKP